MALIFAAIDCFLIKGLYDKCLNYGNIEKYKETIEIPDDLKELD